MPCTLKAITAVHDAIKRPGEGDIVARGKSEYIVRRYDHYTPTIKISEGDVGDWCLYAGTSCEGIADIPSASDLVYRLWQDFQNEQKAL